MSEQRAVRVLVPVELLDRAQELHVDVPKLMVNALAERIEANARGYHDGLGRR